MRPGNTQPTQQQLIDEKRELKFWFYPIRKMAKFPKFWGRVKKEGIGGKVAN